MTSSSVDEDQYSYLKERNINCGIETEDKSEESSSRIMNAKPSTKTFSWTAQVDLTLYKDKRYISENDKNYGVISAQGSFISDKAVITCAHCICNNFPVDKEWPYLITCGAENPTGVNRQNLNFKGKNEINVYFGKRTPVIKDDIEFDNNIIAYVYKYERSKLPTTGTKNYKGINGDVGIILMEKNIDLVQNRISPICLPTPGIFKRKSVIDLKFVGWGLRSSFRFDPAGNMLENACFTNGAREYDKDLYPDTDGISIVPCEVKKEGGEFCMADENDSNGFVKNGIYAISYKTKLMLKQDIIDRIKKDPIQEKCAKYMKEAEKKWVNAKKNLNPDKSYAGS